MTSEAKSIADLTKRVAKLERRLDDRDKARAKLRRTLVKATPKTQKAEGVQMTVDASKLVEALEACQRRIAQLESAPAVKKHVERQALIGDIRSDAECAAALVNGSVDQRAKLLRDLPQFRRRLIVPRLGLDQLVAVARDLPADARTFLDDGLVSPFDNARDMIAQINFALIPTSSFPEVVRIRGSKPSLRFGNPEPKGDHPVFFIDAYSQQEMLRSDWDVLLTIEKGELTYLPTLLARGDIAVETMNERDQRDFVHRELRGGRLTWNPDQTAAVKPAPKAKGGILPDAIQLRKNVGDEGEAPIDGVADADKRNLELTQQAMKDLPKQRARINAAERDREAKRAADAMVKALDDRAVAKRSKKKPSK